MTSLLEEIFESVQIETSRIIEKMDNNDYTDEEWGILYHGKQSESANTNIQKIIDTLRSDNADGLFKYTQPALHYLIMEMLANPHDIPFERITVQIEKILNEDKTDKGLVQLTADDDIQKIYLERTANALETSLDIRKFLRTAKKPDTFDTALTEEIITSAISIVAIIYTYFKK